MAVIKIVSDATEKNLAQWRTYAETQKSSWWSERLAELTLRDGDYWLDQEKGVFARPMPETLGRVLSVTTTRHYVAHDDDRMYWTVTAIVVNDDGSVTLVRVNSYGEHDTFLGQYSALSTVDVADELVTAKLAYDAKQKADQRRRQIISDAYDIEQSLGHYGIVMRGRKIPKGTTGRIGWLREGQWGLTIGLDDVHGKRHFVSAKNVDVVPHVEDDIQCEHGKPIIGACRYCDA